MPITLNKNILLSLLLALVCVLIVVRIIPASVDPVIKLVISKNKVSIKDLQQQRNIETTKDVMVDILNIGEQNRFKHPKLGEIGFGSDFFVDIDAPFTVTQGGKYQFIIASDDGFNLLIDDKSICQFRGSRPMSSQTCNINLTKGLHRFKLFYYQGYGNAGLRVQHTKVGSHKTYWVGADSESIKFNL